MQAAFLLLGCGLSGYEERMLAAQTYLENRDHEEQILGAPLAPPPRLGADGKKTGQPAVDLFIRPPRGIDSQYDPEPFSDIMWRYGVPKSGPAAALNCPLIAMYLAVSTTMDRDQFWQEIQNPFMSQDISGISKVTETPIDGPPLEFEYDSRTVEERGSAKTFFMYVYRKDLPDGKVARVAIIFCAPENVATGAAVQEAIHMCLKTLSVGGRGGGQKRRRY